MSGFIERPLTEAIRVGGPRKPVYVVGINDAPYITSYVDSEGRTQTCPYHQRWRNMLHRAYCPKYSAKWPTYLACSVEPAWFSFMAFRAWMETQDWKNKELDKDLLDQGNKHYGPATCIFISTALNRLLCLKGNARGAYPLGVSMEVRYNKTRFLAKCSFYSTTKFLGRFVTIEEAALAYKQAKLSYIKELANTEQDPRIKQALLRLF